MARTCLLVTRSNPPVPLLPPSAAVECGERGGRRGRSGNVTERAASLSSRLRPQAPAQSTLHRAPPRSTRAPPIRQHFGAQPVLCLCLCRPVPPARLRHDHRGRLRAAAGQAHGHRHTARARPQEARHTTTLTRIRSIARISVTRPQTNFTRLGAVSFELGQQRQPQP